MQTNEEFETSLESLQHDLDKAKYANMVLENHMHELRLEMEKNNKLISSSFHQVGLGQIKKNVSDPSEAAQPDWLDS
jgi:hypothetical protein